MVNTLETNRILDTLQSLYPDVECELIHKNAYELIVAVALSAQTTDVNVNKVTPRLFEKYPDVLALSLADLNDVQQIIKSLGLYKTKSNNIILMAKIIVADYDQIVPNKMKDLCKLNGVGRKTANVVLSVAYNVPTIAVDTHVNRIAKRLGFAKNDDDVLQVEKKLMRKIDRSLWSDTHHRMIHFGRYFCTARNPKCNLCPLVDICKEKNKNIIKGK